MTREEGDRLRLLPSLIGFLAFRVSSLSSPLSGPPADRAQAMQPAMRVP